MAAEFKLSRSQLIYGLCLPLAVILGYVLARPMESPSLGVLIMVACVLGVPLYMRWYHPLTIFFWNATFYLGFLPGGMPVWVGCSVAAFVIILLNRCVDPFRRLMIEPGVAWSLVGLAVVFVLTAYSTGGIGMRSLGSHSYGGKRYVFLLASIMGYFVLASQRIPLAKANWYAGLYFLPGMTEILGTLVYLVGGSFYILFYVVPAGGAYALALADEAIYEPEMLRLGSLSIVAQAISLYMLARYGVRGLLDSSRPWRGLFLVVVLMVGAYGGYRSYVICLGLIFVVAFFLEGLHRTRLALMVAAITILFGVGLMFFSTKLPYSVQRTLSFLPVEVAPDVKLLADDSVNWRLNIWRNVLPDVSRYWLHGKGYVVDPNELYMAEISSVLRRGPSATISEIAGDYHNGPLSVLIPFGIWGALGLAWFFVAAMRMMYRNYRHGDPSLKNVNVALLACFIGKVIFFVTVYGGISLDLATFAGLAGLSASLNGQTRKHLSRETTESEFSNQYV